MHKRIAARPAALPADRRALQALADQALSRTAGAPLVGGNDVLVLRDATENYPRWEAAIAGARQCVHIEMYIFHRDRTGRRFVDLLAAKAREGVPVRLIYDWFGCGTSPLRGLFGPLLKAGGEVRAFNPPSFANALGWLRRDHRKLLSVDGRVAYVSGLCIGEDWEGRPDKGREPWRDTGVEIHGPVVRQADEAFAESWRLAGGNHDDCLRETAAPDNAGTVSLRLIPTEPFTANLLRLDLLVSAIARRRLWISDAYFIGTGPYLEALKRASADGVDVRLLLPQGSDVEWTVPVSRSLYRPLLEAGVRIFEWNGTMMHAKTAVVDSRWARIGSTNLNLNSWLGNWELDVAIEDERIARTLEGHFEEDIARSVEIVLRHSSVQRPKRPRTLPPRRANSRRVVRTMSGLGHSIGAAVTGNRPLEDFEMAPVLAFGVFLAALALLGWFAPRAIGWPVAIVAGWMAATFFVEAWRLWRRKP